MKAHFPKGRTGEIDTIYTEQTGPEGLLYHRPARQSTLTLIVSYGSVIVLFDYIF